MKKTVFEDIDDIKPISFKDWLKKWNWQQVGDSYVFKKGNTFTDKESLLISYNKEFTT